MRVERTFCRSGKYIALGLGGLLLFAVAGCKGGDSGQTVDEAPTTSSTPAETTATSPAASAEASATSSPAEATTTAPTETTETSASSTPAETAATPEAKSDTP